MESTGYVRILSRLPPTELTRSDEILKPKAESRLSEGEFAQPCCTALQVALVDLLQSWGIYPAAVTGHSSGEIAAAYASGALTAQEAISCAFYRGLVMTSLDEAQKGGMAAIGLGRDEVLPCLVFDGVSIGCENSPSSTTLTGDLEALEQTMSLIREKHPDALVRALRVDRAYHSRHVAVVEDQYKGMLQQCLTGKPPQIPFFSSMKGHLWKSSEALSTAYWVENFLRPVLFQSAVESTVAGVPGPIAFLEVGPHSALAGPIRQTTRGITDRDISYFSTLMRGENSMNSMLKTAGELWMQSVDLVMDQVNHGPGKILTDLPRYPWHYDAEYWGENRLSNEWRHRKFPYHDVLGLRILETSHLEPAWRNVLRLETVPWVRDHDIAGNVLFPAAAYISMIGEALRQLSGVPDYTVGSIVFMAPILVSDGSSVEVFTHLRKSRLTDSLDSEWYDFSISSLVDGKWAKHCVGAGAAGKKTAEGAYSLEPLVRQVSADSWYEALSKVGMKYGPRFAKMQRISADVSANKAVATVADDRADGESTYQLHPSTLDSCCHLISCAAFRGRPRLIRQSVVITSIDEIYIQRPDKALAVYAEADISQTGSTSGNVVATAAGEVVLSIKGLHTSPPGGTDSGEAQDAYAAAEMEWQDDISFMNINKLLQSSVGFGEHHALIEKLCVACLIESHHQVRLPSIKFPILRCESLIISFGLNGLNARLIVLSGTRRRAEQVVSKKVQGVACCAQ